MEKPAVRPAIKAALFLACLVTLAAAYFASNKIPFFAVRLFESAAAVMILLAAGGVGSQLLKLIKGGNGFSTLERFIFAETLGLGGLSLLMVGIGAVYGWYPLTGWVVIAGGIYLSRDFWPSLRNLPGDLSIAAGELRLFSMLGLALGLILSFILVWAPITYYDSLVYHLALPGAYIQAHHWLPVARLIYSAFPQTTEMIWLLGLLAGDPIVVNLLGWSMAVLLLAAVLAFCQRFLDAAVGWTGAALLILMPAMLLLASGGYVDVALTLFCFMTVFAACLWNEKPGQSALILAGLMAGWTVGVKYTGALPVFLIFVFIIARSIKLQPRETWRNAAAFAIPALVVFSPWLIKNWLFVGNPVFPFFYEKGIARLNPWIGQAAAGYFAAITEYYSRPIWTLPMVLWETAVNGIGFGRGIDVLGDFGWIPLISLLPALWICRQRPYYVKVLLVISAGFFGFWAVTRPVLRFLLPISPLLAILAGYAYRHGVRVLPPAARWLSQGILAAFLLSGLFLFCYTNQLISPFAAALGLESPDDYLIRRVNYYAAAQYVNTQLPPKSKIYVLGDQRGFYYERQIMLNPVFSKNPFTEWANESEDAAELRIKIGAEGITHILVNRPEFERLTQAYPYLQFSPAGQANWDSLQAHGLRKVYHDLICDVYAL